MIYIQKLVVVPLKKQVLNDASYWEVGKLGGWDILPLLIYTGT